MKEGGFMSRPLPQSFCRWLNLGPTGFCQFWADGTTEPILISVWKKPWRVRPASLMSPHESPTCSSVLLWDRPCWSWTCCSAQFSHDVMTVCHPLTGGGRNWIYSVSKLQAVQRFCDVLQVVQHRCFKGFHEHRCQGHVCTVLKTFWGPELWWNVWSRRGFHLDI